VKALLRVDDKKELSNPPRVQEKELKEPERISLRTPNFLGVGDQLKGKIGLRAKQNIPSLIYA